MKQAFVYIMASERNGTIYTGVTNDLVRRTYEHRTGMVEGFTTKYGIKTLIYFEIYESISQAIQREKNLKKWPRKWKTDLIEENNPQWRDLYDEICT